jgi:recombination protein RecR
MADAKRSNNAEAHFSHAANDRGSRAYPESVNRLMAEFARLPGIGKRTAERLAFFMLKSEKSAALRLADAIRDVKTQVRHCAICLNLTEASPCPICSDPRRDAGLLIIVEQPKDLISLEQTGMNPGIYHVLMGHLSPLEGVGPGDLALDELFGRIEDAPRNARGEAVREIVLGLNPNMEGDGTALFIADEVARRFPNVKISRLARGLPTGSQLEYASKAVLADAIVGRRPME